MIANIFFASVLQGGDTVPATLITPGVFPIGAFTFQTAPNAPGINDASGNAVVTYSGAASVASLTFQQVTARIIGGSTNGLAIRNSANTRDNFMVQDNALAMTMNTGSRAVTITSLANGEATTGFYLQSQTAGEYSGVVGVVSATGGIRGAYYNNTDALYLSAWEVANQTGAGVKSTLSLMKSGGVVAIQNLVAPPAAGAVGSFLGVSSTAGLGMYWGSGAPTVSAAQGSIYLRTDGNSIATRLYVNTNGTIGWTNFVSAA